MLDTDNFTVGENGSYLINFDNVKFCQIVKDPDGSWPTVLVWFTSDTPGAGPTLKLTMDKVEGEICFAPFRPPSEITGPHSRVYEAQGGCVCGGEAEASIFSSTVHNLSGSGMPTEDASGTGSINLVSEEKP